MDTPEARCLLLAIAAQESGLAERYQFGGGEANGFWQFQLDGVAGAMSGITRAYAETACAILAIDPDPGSVWQAIEYNDVLAAVIARLTLWPDPAPLPAVGDWLESFGYYVRRWKPGKEAPERWATAYDVAVAAIQSA